MSPRPNYGISRIEQEEKKNFGWNVRITNKGKTTHKYFPDKSCGGKNKALKLAREFRDAVLRKMPKAKQEAASRPMRKVKKSGVVGVTHVVSKAGMSKVYEYWQAAWEDAAGRRRTAKFSISRYGNKPALELAVQARKDALKGRTPKRPSRGTAAKKTAGKATVGKKAPARLKKPSAAAGKKPLKTKSGGAGGKSGHKRGKK